LSTGLGIEQELGGGLAARVFGRIGLADLEPGGEASLSRTNLTRTIGIGGYHRLVSAGDWGNPLSFGGGVSALLFARDEGFYYRATGAELTYSRVPPGGSRATFDARLFAERQHTAVSEAAYSVSGNFIPNILALEHWTTGATARLTKGYGLDPQGVRAFGDLRLETALGEMDYARGALDVTLARGLFRGVTSALTLAGGTTVGDVPTQRLWYLGGTHTVRGQRLDPTRAGNAFWLSRAELGRDFAWFRPTLFGDIGWTGDRARLSEIGRPMSGAGVGFSVIDGMLRLDVARGIYPEKRTRLDMYLGARF
jgi:hemolysin activation/secretion protein